jgi:hypothetical protein
MGKEKAKSYKWVKAEDVIVCVVDGVTPLEEFKNYAKMVVEMTQAGWKPYKWKYNKGLKF